MNGFVHTATHHHAPHRRHALVRRHNQVRELFREVLQDEKANDDDPAAEDAEEQECDGEALRDFFLNEVRTFVQRMPPDKAKQMGLALDAGANVLESVSAAASEAGVNQLIATTERRNRQSGRSIPSGGQQERTASTTSCNPIVLSHIMQPHHAIPSCISVHRTIPSCNPITQPHHAAPACNLSMQPQHAAPSCNPIMQPQRAISSCNPSMQPQHATPACNPSMQPQRATPAWSSSCNPNRCRRGSRASITRNSSHPLTAAMQANEHRYTPPLHS